MNVIEFAKNICRFYEYDEYAYRFDFLHKVQIIVHILMHTERRASPLIELLTGMDRDGPRMVVSSQSLCVSDTTMTLERAAVFFLD